MEESLLGSEEYAKILSRRMNKAVQHVRSEEFFESLIVICDPK